MVERSKRDKRGTKVHDQKIDCKCIQAIPNAQKWIKSVKRCKKMVKRSKRDKRGYKSA